YADITQNIFGVKEDDELMESFKGFVKRAREFEEKVNKFVGKYTPDLNENSAFSKVINKVESIDEDIFQLGLLIENKNAAANNLKEPFETLIQELDKIEIADLAELEERHRIINDENMGHYVDGI